MGIYSHYTVVQLQELRDSLTQSLHDRLTKPTSASSATRNARFDQSPEELRKELREVCAELDRKSGAYRGGPIYLVGG